MSGDLTDVEVLEERAALDKSVFSQGIYLGFLCFGVLVSLGLFLAVQSVTTAILSDDYRRISLETSEMIAKEFSELEFSIRTVSTLLSLSDEGDSQKIIEKLNNVETSLEPFESMLWLYKQDGEWALLPLYEDLFKAGNDDYSRLLKDVTVQKAIRAAVRDPSELHLIPLNCI